MIGPAGMRVMKLLVGWILIYAVYPALLFAVYFELHRLSHGMEIDLLKVPGRVEGGRRFTHAASPILSFSANAEVTGLSFLSYRVAGEGNLDFGAPRGIDYRLTAEPKVSIIPIAFQKEAKRSLVVTEALLASCRPAQDGSITVKVAGVYFTCFLTIKNPKSFPAQGYISLIVS